METAPWYTSAIARQQLTAAIIAIGGLLGVNFGDLDVDKMLFNIFAGVGSVIALYTFVTRLFKPAPNLTKTAAEKEIALVKAGTIPPSPTGPATKVQGGFFRLSALLLVAAFAGGSALLVGSLSGCAGTTAAYKASSSAADTAYVVAEHYSAILKEAATLAQNPATSAEVKQALKAANDAVRPLILGNVETGAPGLRQLAKAYTDLRTAKAEEELQRAVDNAARELAKLINAVKAARRG